MKSVQIQFGLECKVIEFGIAFEQFEFDITTQSRKEMIGLSWSRFCVGDFSKEAFCLSDL